MFFVLLFRVLFVVGFLLVAKCYSLFNVECYSSFAGCCVWLLVVYCFLFLVG